MSDIITKKKNLRAILTKKRNLIQRNLIQELNIDVFNELIESIELNKVEVVGSFISIRSEISTKQLNKKIIKMKKKLAFPTIEKNSEELIFKSINSNKKFKLGKFNIPEPTINDKEILIGFLLTN